MIDTRTRPTFTIEHIQAAPHPADGLAAGVQ